MDQKTEKKYPVKSSNYKLYEEVGRGVSASVYRALCIPFNEIVAVKVLDLEKCTSNLDGIRREVQTMSLIDHPNVLRAHCSFVADYCLWVVMPYMVGGCCLHIMKSAYPNGFEEPVIATFLREVLKALKYLHSQGHIHRDVKAGNILVDAKGAVKLGDFGVSACMFESGDRQRSRNTFVGTPCWMAPEVMEQLHGYDFKADIWSFGITALELAHGHAPFSKFPPMKVLLMTLQNAPPGLDYERDKKFSKSFKEIVAMCLVKDPTKRPSAEKLLKHHFFKHARTNDYIVQTVLEGLPPLGERFRTLKMREMDRVAQNKVAYGEKEEKSQSEYIRGISAWNFDIEDLKAQAGLIQDDDEVPFVNEQPIDSKPTGRSLGRMGASLHSYSPFINSRMENTGKDGDHDTRVGLTPASSLLLPQSTTVVEEHLDFNYNGVNACNSTWKDSANVDCTESSKVGWKNFDKDEKLIEDVYDASLLGRKVLSGLLVPECVLLSGDGDREKYQRQLKQRNSSGPLIACSTSNNDSSHKPLEDKMMVAFIEQKGRFKITSEDLDLKEILSQPTCNHSSPRNVASVSTSAILPTLQIILEQNIMQTEQIINLIKRVKQGETPPVWQLNNLNLQHSNSSATENKPEATSDRERKLLQQAVVLERKVENLVDELHKLKIQNLQLEQRLNAALNREKVERSKKEDAAQDIQQAI